MRSFEVLANGADKWPVLAADAKAALRTYEILHMMNPAAFKPDMPRFMVRPAETTIMADYTFCLN